MDGAWGLIALVDDDQANLRIGKTVLSNKYGVYTLPSAATLFEFLEHYKPSIILLDIDMPEMDGYEAIKILKEKEATKDIPVVFLTAKIAADDVHKGLGLGAIDYITKPFVPPLLLKRIEVHLQVRAQQQKLKDVNDELLKLADEQSGNQELRDRILKIVSDLTD
jgi:DNA-binding response OmpR family regulator